MREERFRALLTMVDIFNTVVSYINIPFLTNRTYLKNGLRNIRSSYIYNLTSYETRDFSELR